MVISEDFVDVFITFSWVLRSLHTLFLKSVQFRQAVSFSMIIRGTKKNFAQFLWTRMCMSGKFFFEIPCVHNY